MDRVAPTKEQWAEIERRLRSPFGRVELQCDAFKLTLAVVEAVKTLQFTIMVYVDGSFQGTMICKDCEERRRFMRPRVRCYFKAKDYRSWRRAFGKKAADEQKAESTYHHYEPFWPSFGPLKRHLLANNERIELIAVEYTL
jgi:hypothetical protein